MKYLLAGGSGFLGTALRVRLAEEGHDVVRLVRRRPATATEYAWDPSSGSMDEQALTGVDVVVNLCGAGIANRPWTRARRELLRSSRIGPTRTLGRALAARPAPRPVLIQASGIGRYGTVPTTTPHTEESPAMDDFVGTLVVDWEEATRPAADAGVRTIVLRTAPVLDRSGGVFRPMRLAWSVGLGVQLGDGRQRMPMISLGDYLRVVAWAVSNEDAQGAYNLTIPSPASNAEFTTVLAQALSRPRFLRAPAGVLRKGLGELAEQLVGDLYAVPRRLTEAGFVFEAPDVASAVRAALAGVTVPGIPAADL